MVEPDIFLFAGTVRENLTLWDATIPEEDLVKACLDATIHETILNLPGGYNTILNEGGMNISGGERQRFEIARALVRNPAVLVLDEATSALDAETELIIDRNLRKRGCSCIVVAHRLSTIRDCDEIIVLERGKIVQRGTHEELRHQEGIYAHLIVDNIV
jgi:ABC-type bacteriocin/lantibiotic exporter with double-glycine peptidase domain